MVRALVSGFGGCALPYLPTSLLVRYTLYPHFCAHAQRPNSLAALFWYITSKAGDNAVVCIYLPPSAVRLDVLMAALALPPKHRPIPKRAVCFPSATFGGFHWRAASSPSPKNRRHRKHRQTPRFLPSYFSVVSYFAAFRAPPPNAASPPAVAGILVVH